jgi:hypothetical protein
MQAEFDRAVTIRNAFNLTANVVEEGFRREGHPYRRQVSL